ncbi:MAG: hypothetical protein AAGK37_14130 [Pseudomonadota bacterium]
MRRILLRAWTDTISGQMLALCLAFLGSVISIAFIWFWVGRTEALEQVQYAIAALVGAIGSLTLFFLLNLVCAPYRLQGERVLAAERERDEWKAKAQTHSQPRARRLNAEQKGLLASALRESGVRPEKMDVHHYQSEECQDFATDTSDAIAQAGVESSAYAYWWGDPHDKADRGLKVYISRQKTIQEFAKIARARLESFGYPSELRKEDKENAIYFYVARQQTNEPDA